MDKAQHGTTRHDNLGWNPGTATLEAAAVGVVHVANF
jgi:hypothetical protein